MREMNSALAQLESALRQRHTSLPLFLRDDDVAEDEPSLRQLLALCAQHETPINLAVIPGRLTEGAINYLKQPRGLIELHQHGWQHLNHESTGKKCEFGANRDYAAQRADLAAGQARMNAAFGAHWFPAFTPPWNRCTATTAQALVELGFRALSRDASQPSFDDPRLAELPVTFDLFRWRGDATLRPLNELADELSLQIANADRIGIMLHHKVMDDTAFALLGEWLGLFKQFPLVQFHTLRSLLDPR